MEDHANPEAVMSVGLLVVIGALLAIGAVLL
jgi:hypothetical protein